MNMSMHSTVLSEVSKVHGCYVTGGCGYGHGQSFKVTPWPFFLY